MFYIFSGKKTDNSGRLARDLAITKYYEMKTKKLELEMQILKLELKNKQNNHCLD